MVSDLEIAIAFSSFASLFFILLAGGFTTLCSVSVSILLCVLLLYGLMNEGH